MSKYIITNCPAIEPYCTCAKYYDSHKQISIRCKDITDCVMKRIVNECKEQLNGLEIGVYTLNDILANNILKMLEIEECE